MNFDIPNDVLTGEHALFSPSSGKRWMSCPASIYRSIGRENVETLPAKIGTAAHWVLEYALSFDMDSIQFLDSEAPNGISVDAEMCSNVQIAIDWVRSQLQPGDQLIVESRVNIFEALEIVDEDENPLPIIYGTVDINILGDDGCLTIADYKNGVWGVSVKNNPQLELYGIGAHHHTDEFYERTRLVIIQPNNGGVKSIEVDTEELLAKEAMYWHGVQRALNKGALAVPNTDNCKFCLARHDCAENWEFRNADLIEMAREFNK